MRAIFRGLALSALLAVSLVPTAAAAPPAQAAFAKGTVVALSGTPHLWFADEGGVLHWGGDTRGLAGREIDWNNRREATLDQIRGYQRGDPWLSAGLLKLGDPIYLVKWETNESRPRLLHILSIRDVELFGINATNYGAFILEGALWEQRYGISVDTLQRSQLTPADTATASGVLAADNFDNPAAGILPADSPTPAISTRGYAVGEYVLRKVDPGAAVNVSAALPGEYDNAALAVDVRIIGDTANRYVNLACRRGTGAGTEPKGYILSFRPEAGRFSLQRSDQTSPAHFLAAWQESAAIRRGNQTNRVELRCVGDTIAASFNGTQVVSVRDGSSASGVWWVGTSATNAIVEARLDNLMLTRQ